jgi:hypothetical protein
VDHHLVGRRTVTALASGAGGQRLLAHRHQAAGPARRVRVLGGIGYRPRRLRLRFGVDVEVQVQVQVGLVHDVAVPTRQHPGQQQVRELCRPHEVQPQDRLVLCPRHPVELPLRVAAGVVHEHVDVPVLPLGRPDEPVEAAGIGHVRRHRQRPGAAGPQLRRDRRQLRARPAGEDQAVAGVRQRARDVRTPREAPVISAVSAVLAVLVVLAISMTSCVLPAPDTPPGQNNRHDKRSLSPMIAGA